MENTEKSSLVMDASLHDMLQRYLDTQSYGSIKPVLEGMGTTELPGEQAGQTITYYTLSRAATLHLLNKVMGNEDMIKTYMFIRQGFESLITTDQQRAAAAQASQASSQTSGKRIVEHLVEDNIEQPNDEQPNDEQPNDEQPNDEQPNDEQPNE